MKSFAYWRDPVCIVACLLYAVNRWCVPLELKGAFLRNHFNDTLLIPAALPLMLWLQRGLGLRATDGKPTWTEVFSHLLIWSIAAELVGPRFFASATADLRDVAAYAAGAFVAKILWQLA